MLKLPPELRPRLKRPLGELYQSTSELVERLRELKPAKLVAVGDVVSAELLWVGVKPDVVVVDGRVMRAPAEEGIKRAIGSFRARVMRVNNPPGTISPELKRALEATDSPLKVEVEGEEDLAVLPAVLSAPLGAVVVYGQPGKGVVLVEVTEQKKREFRELLRLFEKPTG